MTRTNCWDCGYKRYKTQLQERIVGCLIVKIQVKATAVLEKKSNLRFRIARNLGGDVLWQLGTYEKRRDYTELSKMFNTLKNVGTKAPTTTVFMSADPKVSIQLVADALNTIAKSGLKDVRLI